MVIILRRIPANTQDDEITAFLDPLLKGNFYQRSSHIESIRTLVLKDNQRNTLEYHGLVTIASEAAANRIIKQLNRKQFKNKPIIVREYFHRSWHNDPRVNMHQWNEELENKRNSTRRRARLEIVTKETLKTSQNDSRPRIL